jgi:ATP-dependent DNA helicase RecG
LSKAAYVREIADALMDSPILRSTLDEFDITFRYRRMTEAEGAGYSRGNVWGGGARLPYRV